MTKWNRSPGFPMADVREYMQQVVTDHVDPLTGEVNRTQLAEDAAYEYASHRWLDDPDHMVFEIAADVAEEYENDQARACQWR